MLPNAKGFLNRFQLVNVPKTSDLFRRIGLTSVPPQSSGDEIIDVIGVDKNGAADAVIRAASNEPPIV